jgi:hypothetical protein
MTTGGKTWLANGHVYPGAEYVTPFELSATFGRHAQQGRRFSEEMEILEHPRKNSNGGGAACDFNNWQDRPHQPANRWFYPVA